MSVYPIVLGSDVFDCFQKFLFYSDSKTGRTFESIRTDNEEKYKGKEFLSPVERKGIVARRSSA